MKCLQHLLGHVEVGDHAVLQRADRLDRAGRAAEHALGLDADRVHFTGARVDRHHARLGQHDPAPAHVHERVRRPQIDRHVAAAESCQVAEDAHIWREGTLGFGFAALLRDALSDRRVSGVYPRASVADPNRRLTALPADLQAKAPRAPRRRLRHCARRTAPKAPSSSVQELGIEVEQGRERQPDDVLIVALRRSARAPPPRPGSHSRPPVRATPRGQIPVEQILGPERSAIAVLTVVRATAVRSSLATSSASPLTTSCVAPLRARSVSRAAGSSGGLP